MKTNKSTKPRHWSLLCKYLTAMLATAALSTFGATLENDQMRIEFEDVNFGLKRIVNKTTGGTEFIHENKGMPSLWGLRFMRTEGGSNVTMHVSNKRGCAEKLVKEGEDSLTFIWKGMTLPNGDVPFDVAARVKLPKGDAMAEWSIQVKNNSKIWALEMVQYPFFPTICLPNDPDAMILAPQKANLGGQLHKLSEYGSHTKLYSFSYPSDRLSMCAVMTGGGGVYYSAQDPQCRQKTMVVAPDSTVWFETEVENAGIVGKAAEGPRFSVTTGCFKGDWWQAAHIYRDWALKQRWAAKGKIAFRSDYPKKPLDTHIWIIGGGTGNYPRHTLETMERVWPDVGRSLTWSEWTYVGGGRATNRNNPEFFPAFPDIPALAKERSQKGDLISIYINGRIWDKATSGFHYAKRDAVKRRNGSISTEDYHSWGTNYHFAVMCPYCPTWQETVKDLALRCTDELNMDAVYFDQVACCSHASCFDPTHGHPLGGGKWWEQGYRQMMTEIKREFVKRGKAIVSEQLGEMWLDLIDVYLNAIGYTPYDVPLFPAIYSGYMMHYGRPVPLELGANDAWREYARTLIWGEAFGWIIPSVPLESNPGQRFEQRAKTIYEMAKLRRDNKDFLVLGTLEGEVRIKDADKDLFGTVWKNAAGTKQAAFIVNASKVERKITYTIDGDANTYHATLPPHSVQTITDFNNCGNFKTHDFGSAGTPCTPYANESGALGDRALPLSCGSAGTPCTPYANESGALGDRALPGFEITTN